MTTRPTSDDLTRAVAAQFAASPAPVDEELWERRMKALTLRNAGGTFRQIAAQLGTSETVARADVRQGLREVLSETIEEGIARQVSVLRDMQRGAYPGAMAGDKDSIMSIVRCLEQEAKLKGYYAPARVVAGISDIDFAEQAVELFNALGQTAPKELMAHVRRNSDAAVAGVGSPAAPPTVDAAEIVDGILERVVGLGFDIPAYSFPVDADPLGADIGDAAISAAAAAAIDPERFGSPDDHTAPGSAGTPDADGDRRPGGWSNL